MLLPMPSAPPVTTTTSFFQSHSSAFQLLMTLSSSQRPTEFSSPSASSVLRWRKAVPCCAASSEPCDEYFAARNSGRVKTGLKAVAWRRRTVVSSVQPEFTGSAWWAANGEVHELGTGWICTNLHAQASIRCGLAFWTLESRGGMAMRVSQKERASSAVRLGAYTLGV